MSYMWSFMKIKYEKFCENIGLYWVLFKNKYKMLGVYLTIITKKIIKLYILDSIYIYIYSYKNS